jgi:beta-glucanase (GH16 family)
VALLIAKDGWWVDATTGEQVREIGGPNLPALVDPATPAGVQPLGMSGKTLTFSDEFENGELNSEKWIPYYPDTPFWNKTTPGGHLTNTDEPQAYDISGISFPGESIMRLTMRDESIVDGLPYTSGMVCSYLSFNQTYGVFEARMKLANVNGAWPAFWMDPTDQTWPPEIDIMENWGKPSFNNLVSQGYIDPVNGNNATNAGLADQDAGNWHTYACEWREGSITWYIDGEVSKTYIGTTPAKNFYIICNLAGSVSSPPDAADLPFSIDVDYIRAWA